MNVAICSNFLMFTDIGVLQTESDNLPFLIDGKSANKHCIARQVSNRFIQVDQSIFGGPQKGPCTERAVACSPTTWPTLLMSKASL